jgi:hypothetical protein
MIPKIRNIHDRHWEGWRQFECVEWLGAKTGEGYGQVWWVGGKHRAHRLSFHLTYGVPLGVLPVRHYCGNPACIEPRHLWLDANADDVKASMRRLQASARPRAPARRAAMGTTQAPVIGSIYVIGFADYVKIGISADLDKRIKALQTAIPEKLTVYATIDAGENYGDLEMALHARFAAFRRNGEWFSKEGELADWIAAGCPIDDNMREAA